MKFIKRLIIAFIFYNTACSLPCYSMAEVRLPAADSIPVISVKQVENNLVNILLIRKQFPGVELNNPQTLKYFQGDSAVFSKPEFDDSNWKKLNSNDESNFGLNKIYWGRTKFKVHPNLLNKPLVLNVYWQGAMDIFLNNNLIYSFGSFSTSKSDTVIYDADYFPIRKLNLIFKNNLDTQVLAFRFGRGKQSSLIGLEGSDVLTQNPSLDFTLHQQNIGEKIDVSRLNNAFYYGFFIGTNCIIILLTLFQVKRKQKKYTLLQFSLFTFFTALVALSNLIDKGTFSLPSIVVIGISALNSIGYSLSTYFLLLVMKSLFDSNNRITSRLYFIWAIAMLFSYYYETFTGKDLSTIIFLLLVMSLIELMRLSWLSVRNKVHGSWIIVTGALIFIIGGPVLEQLFNALQMGLTRPFWSTMIIRITFYLSMPVSLSIFLAQQSVHINKLLSRQRDELDHEVQERTAQLKASQEELIKSEKLAAFGNVATRMAHEIQNPLNFVNNFSELSQELIDEVADAKTQEEKTDVLNTLKENLVKINQHGRRASKIVRELQENSNKGTAHEFFGDSSL